ncbi:hypothetical protein P3J6_110250 [Pseudoalteromonas sp. 3J6]|nr:hypothetical protein P3J6_110250 [Pseudoalteromonas sp. 3J6]
MIFVKVKVVNYLIGLCRFRVGLLKKRLQDMIILSASAWSFFCQNKLFI